MGTGQQINCGPFTSLYPEAAEPNMVPAFTYHCEPETNESGPGQSVRRVTVGGDVWRPHTNCDLHFQLYANPMFNGR